MNPIVKICGLTSLAALDAALAAGADMVGLVRFEKSPRHLELEQGRALSLRARGKAERVALVVDADDAALDAVVAAFDPDLLQLHGAETPERVAAIRARLERPVMKAIGIASAADLAAVAAYRGRRRSPAPRRQAAGRRGALPGGNGVPFDWRLLAGLDAAMPVHAVGGLDADNVGEAIAARGRHGGRCLVGRRERARRQGSGADRGLHRRPPAPRSAALQSEDKRGVNVPVQPNSFRTGPDEHGHFGMFGGRFVAETLMPLILELERPTNAAKADPAFQAELDATSTRTMSAGPSPLYFAERLTEHLGGAKIYFKREELNHTGAHKINNCLGQILLARRMGKTRIIAETGAGQHGVATATVCARFGLPCVVYMGATDVERQKPNVFRMKLLGAEVRAGDRPATAR